MAVRQLARKHVRQQLAGDELHGATHRRRDAGALPGRRGDRLHPSGQPGAPLQGLRPDCAAAADGAAVVTPDPDPDASPGPGPCGARRPGRDAQGRPDHGHSRAQLQRPGHHLGPVRRRGAAAARRRDGSPSIWCAASPWCRSRSGVWNWGRGSISLASDAHNAAVEQAARPLRGECSKVHGHGVVGVRVEVSVRTHHIDVELVGTAVRPMARAPARTPGRRCRPGHAVRLGPVGPGLHPAGAGRLDARRPRLRRQLRLRPPPHRRYRHEADDAERRADQLHRGHVLRPRVGHGEDAALRARRRGTRGWWRSRSRRAR